MPAVELVNRHIQIADNACAAIRILRVDPAVVDSQHECKYSLSYIVDGASVMRDDNERGKGDLSISVTANFR